jgi:hypothetical protein
MRFGVSEYNKIEKNLKQLESKIINAKGIYSTLLI